MGSVLRTTPGAAARGLASIERTTVDGAQKAGPNLKRWSKSAIDRLGDALRNADELSPDDLEAYREVRDLHEDVLASVQERLAEVGIRATGHTKTHGTLIDKLKRETIRLSQVQDIAGCRIVVDGGREDQDDVVALILDLYPDAKPVDRRIEPTHGYRAVHLIISEGVCNVEVQIRTRNQDTWAQIVEAPGRCVGETAPVRGAPSDPEVVAVRTPGAVSLTRQEIWDLVMRLAELLDAYESGADLGYANMDALLWGFQQVADMATGADGSGVDSAS